jgi:hypothetical protein
MKLAGFNSGKPKNYYYVFTDTQVPVIKFYADKNLSEIENLYEQKMELKKDKIGLFIELNLSIEDESKSVKACSDFKTIKLRHNQYLIVDFESEHIPMYYVYSIRKFKQLIKENNILEINK